MSKQLRHSVGRATLLLVTLLLSLVCMPRFARADQATTTITVKVRMFQEYKVDVSGLQNTFEYVIEPSEEGAPLPVDADGNTFDKFTLKRDEDLWLEFPVRVAVDPEAKTYVYHYRVRPAQKELSDGLYYVNVLSNSLEAGVNEYLLEIHVYPSITETVDPIVVPTVHVEGWDGPKVSDPGWRISYKAPDEKKDDKQDEKQDDNQTGNQDNKQDGSQTGNQSGNQDNKSDASPVNKQTTSSSTASNPATVQRTTSPTASPTDSPTTSPTDSLATKGDSLPVGFALAGAAVVGAPLIGWGVLHLWKAGDHHA